MIKYLDNINGPEDLKILNTNQLKILADEVRAYMVETVSKNGGHLASSLGVVELTLALHKVFDSPNDKIIFDVGHQSYAHKIVTGRREEFKTLRTEGGISGFPKMSESEHDAFDTGHSSTSISVAFAMAKARDLKQKHNHVVAVIGDASLSSGMAFEALNHAGHNKTKLIVILNDNEMAISKSVGSMSKYLTSMRTKPKYIKTKSKTVKVYEGSPFGLYSILKVKDFTMTPKTKCVNGEWVKLEDELEPILTSYEVIK